MPAFSLYLERAAGVPDESLTAPGAAPGLCLAKAHVGRKVKRQAACSGKHIGAVRQVAVRAILDRNDGVGVCRAGDGAGDVVQARAHPSESAAMRPPLVKVNVLAVRTVTGSFRYQ